MNRFPSARRAAAILAAVLSSGCADSASDRVWQGTVRDSASITIVENQGGSIWAEGERWTFTEVLRIGSATDEIEYAFGNITGLGLLADGRIAVADGLAREVRFFFSNGKHQHTVGRGGSGPGEFGRLDGIVATSGDTVLVLDGGNRRVHRISPEGTWLGSTRMVVEDGIPRGWQSRSGRIVSLVSLPYQMIGERPPPSPVASLDHFGVITDTIFTLPPSGFYSSSSDGQQFWYHPGEPHFCLGSDGGIVGGHGDQYELTWYDSDGSIEKIARVTTPDLSLTEADQALVLRRVAEELRERNRTPERIAQRQSWTYFLDEYPAFAGLLCGPTGSVFAQRIRSWSALSEDEFNRMPIYGLPPIAPELDVFDTEGRLLGVVTIPPRFEPVAFRGTVLYGIWLDDFDVQHVLGLALNTPSDTPPPP